MRSLRLVIVLASLAFAPGCPGGDDGGGGGDLTPDAAVQPMADAAPPPPDARPRVGYGEACVTGADCLSGLCVSEAGGASLCSRSCSLLVAHDCKDVDAFCVPTGDSYSCWGEVETGQDLDDAIVEIGDSVTRAATPLDDADLFQVRINQLGNVLFQVTTDTSVDLQLEAYGVLGDALGVANMRGPGEFEALQTEVQQVGGHLWLLVRNVGTSTGSYTFSVTEVPDLAATTSVARLRRPQDRQR